MGPLVCTASTAPATSPALRQPLNVLCCVVSASIILVFCLGLTSLVLTFLGFSPENISHVIISISQEYWETDTLHAALPEWYLIF